MPFQNVISTCFQKMPSRQATIIVAKVTKNVVFPPGYLFEMKIDFPLKFRVYNTIE